MVKRMDVTFYDTFTYAPSPPQVPITHNNFYIAFALEDPATYNPFINEGVYIPKAYFKRAEMKGEEFEWKVVPLEIERCQLSKFGAIYQDVFARVDLNNYYCFKDINNFILEGHFSYLLYSFFYIEFYPCVNTSESKKCEPKEIMDYYLNNTFVSFEMENIELTPKNYKIQKKVKVLEDKSIKKIRKLITQISKIEKKVEKLKIYSVLEDNEKDNQIIKNNDSITSKRLKDNQKFSLFIYDFNPLLET